VVCLAGSPEALCAAADFPDPPRLSKNSCKGVDSLCCYGNTFKVFAGVMVELWIFVLAIAVLLVGLAAIVLWGAFR
jgi:hypothetical protein